MNFFLHTGKDIEVKKNEVVKNEPVNNGTTTTVVADIGLLNSTK